MDACIVPLTINFKKGIGALASIVSMLFVLQVLFFLFFEHHYGIMETNTHISLYICYIHTYIYICIYIVLCIEIIYNCFNQLQLLFFLILKLYQLLSAEVDPFKDGF